MGKNKTKAEKAKRNLAYAMAHKKKSPSRRFAGPRAPRPPFGSPGEGPGAPLGEPSVVTSPRTMYPAVCSTCGAETTVPFEPKPGRPVQCRNCFQPPPRA